MAIAVTNPISTSEWKKETEYAITWTGGGTGSATTINLYKGGTFLENIYSGIVESQYLWTPGAGLTTGNDYQIYVEYDSLSDYSDEFLIYSAFTVQLNDGLGIGDSMTKAPTKIFSDDLSLSDAILKFIGTELSDDLSLSDAILRFIGRELSDNLTLSDSIVKQITKILSDNLSLSDSLIKIIDYVKTLSDDLTLDDSFLRSISRPLSDNLTISDSIAILTTGSTSIIKIFSDDLTLSDSIVRKITRPYLVYDTMRDSWTEFYFGRDYIGGDTGVIIQAVSLTAGDTLENSNLLLQEYEDTTTKQDINKYPTSEISTDTFYKIQTKDFYYEKGVLRRVYLSYKLDDPGNTKPTLVSIVKTENVATTTKVHTIEEVGSNIWYGVANSKSRGRDFSVIVNNADIIEYINLDFKIRAIG